MDPHLLCEAEVASWASATNAKRCLCRNLVENIFSRKVYAEYQRRWDAALGQPWRQGVVSEYFLRGVISYNRTRSASLPTLRAVQKPKFLPKKVCAAFLVVIKQDVATALHHPAPAAETPLYAFLVKAVAAAMTHPLRMYSGWFISASYHIIYSYIIDIYYCTLLHIILLNTSYVESRKPSEQGAKRQRGAGDKAKTSVVQQVAKWLAFSPEQKRLHMEERTIAVELTDMRHPAFRRFKEVLEPLGLRKNERALHFCRVGPNTPAAMC